MSRPRTVMGCTPLPHHALLLGLCAVLSAGACSAGPDGTRMFVEGERLWDHGTLARSLWADRSAAYSGGVLPMMGGVDPQEVLRVPLPGPLQPGRYHLFARAWSDSGRGPGECELELWLGGRMRRLSWTNHADYGKLLWAAHGRRGGSQTARRGHHRLIGEDNTGDARRAPAAVPHCGPGGACACARC